jgi:hypothetical protein
MKFKKLLEGRSHLYKKDYNELIQYFLKKANNDRNKAYELVERYLNIAMTKYSLDDLDVIIRVKKYFEQSNTSNKEVESKEINDNKILNETHKRILKNFERFSLDNKYDLLKRYVSANFSKKLQDYLTKEKVEDILNRLNKNTELRININLDEDEVINDLISNGRLKNQFETKTSEGTLDPVKGGARDSWEKYLFDEEFQDNKEYKRLENYKDELPKSLAKERPIYGYIKSHSNRFNENYYFDNEFIENRYGNDTIILKKEVNERNTFTLVNSSGLSDYEYGKSKLKLFRGTSKHNIAMLYNILNSFQSNKEDKIIDYLEKEDILPIYLIYDSLYIETQILGEVDLKRDIEKIVIDYSYDRENLDKIKLLCKKYNIPLYVKDQKSKDFMKELKDG